MRCEVEGIGSVENPIIDWSDDLDETDDAEDDAAADAGLDDIEPD